MKHIIALMFVYLNLRLIEVNIAWTALNAASIKSVCQNISKDIEKLNLSGCLKEITDNRMENFEFHRDRLS